MPVALSCPGVYIEEVSSGVRTVSGVATSVTAFVGRARRGPTNTPVVINSQGEYERRFGRLWNDSTLGFAVRDFFLNGGGQALVVRLFRPRLADEAARTAAQADAAAPAAPVTRARLAVDTLGLEAAHEGSWGNALRARIDHDTAGAGQFNLSLRDTATGDTETHRNLAWTAASRAAC